MFPSLLIVDDEASILQTLGGLLGDEGFEVATATNGYEALKKIESESPDLVLLDIWMPGIDGIETLKEIKKANSSPGPGDHHHRARHHRDRRQGHQTGGLRSHRKTVVHRQGPRGHSTTRSISAVWRKKTATCAKRPSKNTPSAAAVRRTLGLKKQIAVNGCQQRLDSYQR
jgi:CheY-like chemotaxis protein